MVSVFPRVPLEFGEDGDRSVKILKEADYIAQTSGKRNFPWRYFVISTEAVSYTHLIGEAYFFRAMLYYEQFLRKFGGAPWIDKTLDLESGELYGPRLKRHELADKILNDMDDAIDRLPTYSQQETGRVSKEAAMLYKARIALDVYKRQEIKCNPSTLNP